MRILHTSPTDTDATVIDKINVMLKMYEIDDFKAEFKAVKKGSWRPFKLHHKPRYTYGSKTDKRMFGKVIPIRHFEDAQSLAKFVQDKILSRVQQMRDEETA